RYAIGQYLADKIIPRISNASFQTKSYLEKIVVLIMDTFAITLVEFLIRAVRVYFTAGLIFAVLFSLLGVQRTDQAQGK
ncbi:MAG: hypothetical protein AAFZ35_07465, partial [Cyanobacteria bacterium J06649_12]